MTFFEKLDKEEFEIQASDGTRLYCKIYRPKKQQPNPRRIVIHHGWSDHSGRYNNIIETLQDSNFIICLFDARGNGLSDGIRGHADSFATFQSDLDLVIRAFLEKTGGGRTILFGHSTGAVVAALYAQNLQYKQHLSALVLSSLASRIKMNLATRIKKLLTILLYPLFPSVIINAGVRHEAISHDPVAVKQYAEDKLVHGMISFSMGRLFLIAEKELQAHPENIDLPVYMFHGTQDSVAEKTGSIEFYQKLKTENKTLKLYDGLFHETFNEYPLNRQQVLNDLKEWLTRIEHD